MTTRKNKCRVISPTTRKRLEFIALIPIIGGDIHYRRWPERGAFSKTRFDGPQTRRKR